MSVDTLLASEDEGADTDGRGRRGPIIAVIGVLALALGGGVAWWLLFAGGGDEEALRDGEVVVLEPLTTTLGEASLRHARVTLAVVLSEGERPEVVPKDAAMLQDALLREIAKLDADELRSSEGSDALRQRLTEEAQEIWGGEVVRRVLLTELLIQ